MQAPLRRVQCYGRWEALRTCGCLQLKQTLPQGCTASLPGTALTAGHEEAKRAEILGRMFQSIDPSSPPYIEPPFICDYVSVTAARTLCGSLHDFGHVLSNER